MSQHKHLKPIYWGLFSVGGTVAALALAPIILVMCIMLPLGMLGDPAKLYANVHGLIAHKLVFLILSGLVFTMLWHGCHRFYYILHDMHIHVGNRTRLSFYGFALAAFAITLLCGWF